MDVVNAYIQNKLAESFSSNIPLQHTHPPMRIVVADCEYCKRFGNCFKRSSEPECMP